MSGSLCFNVDLAFLQHEVLAHHALPDLLNIFNDGLEVGRRVVGASDEDVVLSTRCRRRVEGADGDEPKEEDGQLECM